MSRKIVHRTLACILAVILAVSLAPAHLASASAEPIPIFIDNVRIVFDADPFIENGITMVPIRAVVEGLGATVNYANKTVSFKRGGKTVKLVVGSNDAVVDGQSVPVTATPVIRSNRTYVPLRFVSENLGVTVNYEYREVYIWTKAPITQHSGNFMNGNTMAETESAIYWIDEFEIYEQNKATGESRKMSLNIAVDETKKDDAGRVITVTEPIRATSIFARGGKLYCASMTQILAIDLESGKTSLLAYFWDYTYDAWQTSYIQLLGDNIYVFCEPPGLVSQALRVSIKDGSVERFGYMFLSYCVSGGYIYMINVDRYYDAQITAESTVSIKKMSLSGKTIDTIYSAKGRFMYNLAVHDGKIYFMVDSNDGTCIERINLDGSGLETLYKSEYLQTYNLDGGNLYYSIAKNTSQSTSGGIYKMDLETLTHTKLSNESTDKLMIINGRLYFRGSQGIDSIDL